MKPFKDNEGRPWSLSINVASVKRIKELAGVDLLSVGDFNEKVITQLADDPVMLVNVVYAACKPEADGRNISDEAFGTAMGGDSIDAAVTALMSEIADFFPSRRRTVLKAALAKMETGRDLAMKKALTAVEAIDMTKVLADIGDSSTKSPAAAASTPDPTPSAS